ncbi:hypothetical protein BDF19DRAFT_451319 [Syncephalis fuscata]|nr:hypothetical protein BDF19DRAFT_451319 [Syncephalis fuscata]
MLAYFANRLHYNISFVWIFITVLSALVAQTQAAPHSLTDATDNYGSNTHTHGSHKGCCSRGDSSINDKFSSPVATYATLFRRVESNLGPGIVLTTCTVPDSLAITFDDGPGMSTTSVLDALKRQGVSATFFVNGRNIGDLSQPQDAQKVRRAYDEGHQIASHTFSHADLTTLSEEGIKQEMNSLQDLIKGIIGRGVTYMRPPYGNTSPTVLSVLGRLGYYVVNWNLDTNDWRHPTDSEASLQEYRSAIDNGEPGASFIALQHDIQPGTNGQYVERVIAYARSQGKKLVRIDECFGAPGTAYRN